MTQHCGVCQRKLKLVELQMECKCGVKTCQKHRFPNQHECTYNFFDEKRKQLNASLPVVKSPKVPVI